MDNGQWITDNEGCHAELVEAFREAFPLAAPFDKLRVTTLRKPAAVIAPFRGLGVD